MIRIGHGYDVHRFDEQSPPSDIRLGGVDIPAPHALLAHSDGDVLLHALSDALLGAIGAGDIGEHFPDTSDEYRGADSRELLRQVYRQVTDAGYCLGNADITVIAQTPRLNTHKPTMKASIAAVLEVDVDAINVKATTTEKLGFVGRKEGIAVHAVCLLMRSPTE